MKTPLAVRPGTSLQPMVMLFLAGTLRDCRQSKLFEESEIKSKQVGTPRKTKIGPIEEDDGSSMGEVETTGLRWRWWW